MNLDIFTPAPQANLSLRLLSSPGSGKLLIPPGSIVFENLLPHSKKGVWEVEQGEETVIQLYAKEWITTAVPQPLILNNLKNSEEFIRTTFTNICWKTIPPQGLPTCVSRNSLRKTNWIFVFSSFLHLVKDEDSENYLKIHNRH